MIFLRPNGVPEKTYGTAKDIEVKWREDGLRETKKWKTKRRQSGILGKKYVSNETMWFRTRRSGFTGL